MRSGSPQPTLVNPVSLIGVFMAIVAFAITLVLVILGATGAIANPYTGILAFIVGPLVLVFGLLLIPIGTVRERRRRAREGTVAATFPVLDLNQPRQRRAITLFASVTTVILSLMIVTTWGAADYMESKEFCADICHRVMEPEGAAYTASPHARVECVACHIGPGAPWLVRAKISGIRQVVNYTLDRYPHPIPVPIEDLRPSRDTCEQCHWPERFYGDQLRPYVSYAQDEANTATSQSLVFRVGGSQVGQGIHWHTTAKVWYLPLDESRQEIGWVRVEKPDGEVDEYILPGREADITPQRIQQEQRFMDCIDCHNRTAHHFAPIEGEIDKAMSAGSISPKLPFIKQQALQSIGEVGTDVSEEQQREVLRRIDGITEFYRTQRPEVMASSEVAVREAVEQIKSIYRRTVFPHMDVTPSTYPDWIGHDGCFRCHGKLTGSKGPVTGQVVGNACDNCHYQAQVATTQPSAPLTGGAQQPATVPGPARPSAIPHPLDGRDRCTGCHTPGGPGVGAPGGIGTPADHQGRPDSACTGCHKPAA